MFLKITRERKHYKAKKKVLTVKSMCYCIPEPQKQSSSFHWLVAAAGLSTLIVLSKELVMRVCESLVHWIAVVAPPFSFGIVYVIDKYIL